MPRRPPAKRRDHNDLRDLRTALYCRVSLDAGDTEKSVNDQEAEGRRWVEQRSAVLAGVYRDNDLSASRYATKPRPGFELLLGDIEAGKFELVWFWELSRSSRDLAVFAKLRNLCRAQGVRWVVRDRVQDPDDYRDMTMAAIQAVISEQESEQTAERVRRGKRMSAHAGRPPGRVPYGYKRLRNRETGAWERDVPNVFDGDGLPVEDSPAYIVREIFERLAAGHSVTTIRRDLNERGVRTQSGYQWENPKIRYVAMSPTYLGQRVYRVAEHYANRHSERTKAVLEGVDAGWPPLVDAELFWAVQRILTDPARTTTRPGPRGATTLLSAVVKCAECGSKLVRKKQATTGTIIYFCPNRSCVGVTAAALDDYVERVVVRWLSSPRVAADLARTGDTAAAAQARADAERDRAQLQQLYRDVKGGAVSATIATLEEKRLLEAVGEAEGRAQAAALPPVLVGNIGPQAQAGWDALDFEGKRLIIRTIADIRVRRVGRSRRVPVQDRVEWTWLLGPASENGE